MQTKLAEPELITNHSPHARIEQLGKFAELMDGQFRIPGTNIEFGLDAIIGLVPGIGDLVCGAMSMWLIGEARRLGAPQWLIARMIWNVAVEVGVGAVPLVGDLFDVAWKANRKNIQLLRRHFESESHRAANSSRPNW
ncbi:DUF4112 domain-containing protein [Schlesneria paludicola]|uniref:DUF4112 domain-containing protein n=1 Tax=Schlesneria paludicola TaxID=360056 RepID=UPI00029B1955|nr:DUF4112 domain-containing protein [Schlesneria paludicola]